MAIRLSSHLKRNRFGVFYFRRAIPFAIAAHFQQREIYRSLGTSVRRDAIMRARAFGAVTDLIFRKLKIMANKKNQSIEQDMVFELDLEGLWLWKFAKHLLGIHRNLSMSGFMATGSS